MAHKFVDHYFLAFSLYPHSAELLHLISAGHQIVGGLALNDIAGQFLSKGFIGSGAFKGKQACGNVGAGAFFNVGLRRGFVHQVVRQDRGPGDG